MLTQRELQERLFIAENKNREFAYLIKELFEMGNIYPTSIEASDFGVDFEQWAAKARGIAGLPPKGE